MILLVIDVFVWLRGLCENSRTCEKLHFYIFPLLWTRGRFLRRPLNVGSNNISIRHLCYRFLSFLARKISNLLSQLKASFGVIDEWFSPETACYRFDPTNHTICLSFACSSIFVVCPLFSMRNEQKLFLLLCVCAGENFFIAYPWGLAENERFHL